MKLLLFSDVHCSEEACWRLVKMAQMVDVVVGAGDFGSQHRGVAETVNRLRGITTPSIVVPGNNETEQALRDACAAWPAAHVLHGQASVVEGVPFFGLGAGVPTTPWDWSFDLTEQEAKAKLRGCPGGAVLVVHSPPHGHCDVSSAGEHLGSSAILDTIQAKSPKLVVCGHIHESWGAESRISDTLVINAGPDGRIVEI